MKITRMAMWRQLADAIRADILDGTYAPGQPLPSEAQLMRTYEVSRPTVRQALAALRTEGLVESRNGIGSRVRQPPAASLPRLRTIHTGTEGRLHGPDDPTPATEAPRGDASTGATHGGTHEAGGGLVTVEVETPTTYRTSADAVTGPALGQPEGHPLFGIDRLLSTTDPGTRASVRSLHRVLLPFDTVDRAGLDDTVFAPAGALYTRLTGAGFGPLTWTEDVTARMPLPDETAALALPDATPLLHITRTTHAADGTRLLLEEIRTTSTGQHLTYHLTTPTPGPATQPATEAATEPVTEAAPPVGPTKRGSRRRATPAR